MGDHLLRPCLAGVEKKKQLKTCNGRVGRMRADVLSLVRENIRVPPSQKHVGFEVTLPHPPPPFEPLTYGFRDMGQ